MNTVLSVWKSSSELSVWPLATGTPVPEECAPCILMDHSYLLHFPVIDAPKCHKFRLWEAWAHSSPDRIPVIWPGVPHLNKCHLQKVWSCSGKHDAYLMLQFCVGKPTVTILELINLSEQSKCQGPRVRGKKTAMMGAMIFYSELHTGTPSTHTPTMPEELSKWLRTLSCCLQRCNEK